MVKSFRDMLERNPTRKISPELKKMHEIFGDQNADCGMAAQYEDGTCSRIVYDPAKMSFRKRVEIQSTSSEQPQQLTEVEKQAKRLIDFSRLINPKPRRI